MKMPSLAKKEVNLRKLDFEKKITNVCQDFDNKDYEYQYNKDTKIVEKVECGSIQDRINSCNYTQLDKLYDKFLNGEPITPFDAMSQGGVFAHTPSKLDAVIELEENIYNTADNLGIQYAEDITLDDLMELIYDKVQSKGGNESEKTENIETPEQTSVQSDSQTSSQA